MKLVPVEEHKNAVDILYDLLKERTGESKVNISHNCQLTPKQKHAAFVSNHPYGAWYLIDVDGEIVGSVYLTKPPRPSVRGNEIGIFIFERHQRKGYADQAVSLVMDKHGPGRYLANINPENTKSIGFFESKGFRHAESTYEFIKT